MKLCPTCGQTLAEEIRTCPACGSDVGEGRMFVDDYRILEIVHEGHASILCRAVREGSDEPVAVRLFTSQSGVDDRIARRLMQELEELRKLPGEWFVRHDAIRRSSDGLWYRVSEWLEAESWGDLLASGRLQDAEVAYDLFHRLAAILEGLHQTGHFIPHLILNDILVLKGEAGRVDVKIDYKLSRFLDPQMSRPGRMLEKLLNCHPDITGQRPLNYKSDIWSLGRIFVQVLTGDLEICDPRPAVAGLQPRGIEVLVRSMLADDPDLRPHSMAEVAEALARLGQEAAEKKKSAPVETGRQIRRLLGGVRLLAFVVGIVAAAAVVLWFQLGRGPEDAEAILGEYANRYAASVAFVVVEYQVQVETMVAYRQRTEGTAFLVDADGFLLTNRHVACPWLEDDDFFTVVERIRQAGKTPRFAYRIHLWFEGDSAFSRLFGMGTSGELEDVYNLQSGYGSGAQRTLTIAGVARVPARVRQVVRAPLREDFAVLKIDPPPRGLRPLPLDAELDITRLQRLAPVITLGFPLGSRTQADVINVSVTRGHVRRTFDSFFQVDTSLYKGNSGGPIIDVRGQVIGIASAVASDIAVAPLPVITPLSDIGMVLPVNRAAAFVQELKAGRVKWNGVVDLAAESKIKQVVATSVGGQWAEALELSERLLSDGKDPSLMLAAGMMRFCDGDFEGADTLFGQVGSIDADNEQARLMRYLVDRRRHPGSGSAQLRHLMALDWRSSNEFFGYLARIVSGAVSVSEASDAWGNSSEKAWIYYLVGLRALEQGRPDEALGSFRQAVLAADGDEWPLVLALRGFERLSAGDSGGLAEVAALRQQLRQAAADREERLKRIAPLAAAFERAGGDPEARRRALSGIAAIDSENRRLEAILAYYGAMVSDWPEAAARAEVFLAWGGREDALRLGTEVLAALLPYQSGQPEAGNERLRRLYGRIRTPWYRMICETLLGERSETDLLERSARVPENLLTAHVALGLRAEARGEQQVAIHHYREALGSYLDHWVDYDLALQRFLALRRQAAASP